jgi:pilus assembly protein CpaB
MRAVFGLVLVIGLGLAGFAVFMVKGYFEQQQIALDEERAIAAQTVPTVEVYAVNRAVAYGEALTMEDVQMIRYAEPFLPEGVFRTEAELFPKGIEVPRVVLRPMELNEPVLAIKVSSPGEDAGITSRLGRGMRAFAIRVDVASGVSGFLRPGDRVDVYWTGRGGGTAGEVGGALEVTKLIETGIGIVAIDQSADDSQSAATVARTVTVEVTPQQVASLAQAQSTGALSLSLVGNDDDVVATAIEVNQASLLGIEAAAPAPAPQAAPQVCSIRTRRGADVVEIPIPCTN